MSFENPSQLPFEIKRIYWIYDVPGGEIRGSHVFKEQQDFIISLSGSFGIVLRDGLKKIKYISNSVWLSNKCNFSKQITK